MYEQSPGVVTELNLDHRREKENNTAETENDTENKIQLLHQ